ncbi:MAG: GrpB family protein [Planctomycetota bacterium]
MKPTRVVPWNPTWPEAYSDIRDELERILSDEIVRVHHIGSTSVPGLAAKPVIDVLMEVRDVREIDRREPDLAALGYVGKGEHGIPDRRYFTRPRGAQEKTHLHVFPAKHPRVRSHLWFRDFLRGHPGARDEYGELKLRLAIELAGDRDAYQKAKAPFIEGVIRLAELETGERSSPQASG